MSLEARLSAFLRLEEALNKRLLLTWKPYAAKVYAQMRSAIGRGDFDRAREIARTIDMSEVGRKNREWIKYMLFAAGKFGAQNAQPDHDKLAFTVGPHENTLNRVVDAFQVWLSHKATTACRDHAVQLIAQAKDVHDEELFTDREQKQKAERQTLYVRRDLLNADEFIAWAKEQGFDTTLPAGKLHVTLAYSKRAVDWSKLAPQTHEITASGGPREVMPLGDGGAVVLRFESPELEARWAAIKKAGASWDYEGFQPHVTISWAAPPDLDLTKVKPFTGTLKFGPEMFKPLKEGWKDTLVEKSNPYHDETGAFTDAAHAVDRTAQLARPDTWDHGIEDPWYHGSTVGAGGLAEKETHLKPGRDGTLWLTKDKEKAANYARIAADQKGGSAAVFVVSGKDATQDPDNFGSDWVRASRSSARIRRVAIENREAIKKADQRFVRNFVDFSENGDSQLMMASGLHTSRLATWGFCAEAEVAGVTRYRLEAQLDNRTSDFCRQIDGREFEVSKARSLVNRALSVENDEELKHIVPWPKQDKASIARYEEMSDDELEAAGLLIPPFHPYCRTILVRVDDGKEVEVTDEEVQAPEDSTGDLPADSYQATVDTFDELGQEASSGEVLAWNKDIGLAPALVLSKLTGFSVGAIMAGEVTAEELFQNGLYKFTGRAELEDGTFDFDTLIDPDTNELIQNYAEFDNVDPEVASAQLEEMYSGQMDVATNIGAAAIVAGVTSDNVDVMALAGFLPSGKDWDAIRAEVTDKLPGVLGDLDEEQLSVVQDLLESSDPKALIGLVALPWEIEGVQIGRYLLGDVDFEAALDMSDRDAIARYHAMFG